MNFDVFISHASEDKDTVVFPLAEALRQRGFTVWVDAFEIKLGDSLRRKIDEGLSRSRYGVVILSHNFFLKEWPQKELDGLVAREDGKDKVILPVWHNLSSTEVTNYSPILAGKLAVSTSKGIDKVADEITRVLKSSTDLPSAPMTTPASPPAQKDYTAAMESQLVSFLDELTPADFSRVLSRVQGSLAQMPNPGSHYDRVGALLQFVKSKNGIGLQQLQNIIKVLFPSFIDPR